MGDTPHNKQASNVHHRAASPHSLTLHGIDGKFFLSLVRVRARVRARAIQSKVATQSEVVTIIENSLFPVPVEILDKILESLRTPGGDGAVIDAEHPPRRFHRRLALSKNFIDNVK